MSLPENRLLAALPSADFDRLIAQMSDVTLGPRDLIYRIGEAIDHVYFPRTGVISAVVVMLDGSSAEAAVIGLEGMVGITSFLGARSSSEQVYCQIAICECRKMPTQLFIAEVERGGLFRDILYNYIRTYITVSARSTACNCLHSADERCARWLLMCHDRMGNNEFSLTHEFLAVMLGVRRATISTIAATLQKAGIISYRHGRVKVLDRLALEIASCECYNAIRIAFDLYKPKLDE